MNTPETLELIEAPPETSACYTCAPYKQAFYYGQDMRIKYQREYHRADHWKKKCLDYKAKYEYMVKLHFGRKSEKGSQGNTQGEDHKCEDHKPKNHGAQKGHEGSGRTIPLHLPTEERHYTLSSEACLCPSCGLPFKEMNAEEISFEVTVEVIYKLIKHIRKKYRRSCSCAQPIVTAPGPLKLFEKGLYSMDFWIKVLVDKYLYGLPLERQLNRMNAEGLDIASGALPEGLLRMAPMLKPLYELMTKRIAFENLVHGDETRWYNWASRYDPDRSEENAREWLWGLFSKRYHVFIIDPSRGANVIKNKIGQGEAGAILPIIACDRYSSYKALHTLLAFCWAHVRRDFLGLKIKHPDDETIFAWADLWIGLIRDLYTVNHLRLEYREDPERFEAHQKQLEDVIDRMHDLANRSYTKEPQAKQAESMRNHWSGLTLFVKDPDIPIDNNIAERALRTPVVGRKNFYGNHSDRAAEATAIFYSVLSTCKLHHVHPHKFLKRYLTTCVQLRGSPMPEELLERFLPHHYAKQYSEDLARG